MFKTLDISTSGLIGERQRMNAIADNLANLNTTRDADGKPSPVSAAVRDVCPRRVGESGGRARRGEVSDSCRHHDSAAARLSNRDIRTRTRTVTSRIPNIDMMTEFVNAVEASRAYEANLVAIDMAKQIRQLSLKILA